MRIAFGPEALAFGSWDWVALDLCRGLNALGHQTLIFRGSLHAAVRPLAADLDIAVFVKFKPGAEELASLKSRCRLVYCPVDIYGSAAEIDADATALRCFDVIIVHCQRLSRYFSPYARVEYLDHPLKFITPTPCERHSDGPILWIGNRSNLSPVVEWFNRNPFTEPFWVLTDFPNAEASPSPMEPRPDLSAVSGYFSESLTIREANCADCTSFVDVPVPRETIRRGKPGSPGIVLNQKANFGIQGYRRLTPDSARQFDE